MESQICKRSGCTVQDRENKVISLCLSEIIASSILCQSKLVKVSLCANWGCGY